MLPIRIGLASLSADVELPDLVKIANALNVQIARDFAPIWGTTASVAAIEDPQAIDPGIWPIYVCDDLPPDMGGFHQTEHNQPYALVEVGDTWSLSASHECLEMLADPSGNRLVASNAVAVVANELQDSPGKVEYLVEICDPSEDASFGYLVDGVLVSDFYTPRYFDPVVASGVRYSFSGHITRPRQVLENGYLSFYDAAVGKLRQVRAFGAPVIVDLGDAKPGGGSITGGRSLRSFSDRHTRPPRSLSRTPTSMPSVVRREARVRNLVATAAARSTMFAGAAKSAIASHAATPSPAPEKAAQALAAHAAEFKKPGVYSVRTGRMFERDWVTDRRGIVVNVDPAQRDALAGSLPKDLNGVPVEVRAATTMQSMRSTSPAAFHALGAARHELRQPEFPDEKILDGKGGELQPQADTVGALAAALPKKQEIEYTPAPGVKLDAVTAEATLVLHASPDAGWAELSKFLGDVPEELVVGMYDFTSEHVLDAVEDGLKKKKLTLTLDHPAKNPSADQTDEQTVGALRTKLKTGFQSAWALTNASHLAPVWIYPNAYHIKVAVRDDGVFWLSSGNWNNSNQPVIDVTDAAAAKKIAAHSDRDWHVVATSPELAKVFRAYLNHDYEVASEAEAKQAAQGAALVGNRPPPPEVPATVLAAGRAPRKFFPAKTVTGTFPIQPLLTPDNYQGLVLKLIQSAKHSFYMQTQYIHPSGKAGDKKHDDLIAAVAKLVDGGVDVRLITSEYETADWIEKVVDAGIPASTLRIQPRVHNKGIVVDGKVAVVSSQNWSADGTLRNRDAGLIIHSPEVAAYFQEIFLHDWNNLASPSAAKTG